MIASQDPLKAQVHGGIPRELHFGQVKILMRLFGPTSVCHTDATGTIATADKRGQKPQSTVWENKMGIATHRVHQGGKNNEPFFHYKERRMVSTFSAITASCLIILVVYTTHQATAAAVEKVETNALLWVRRSYRSS